MVHSMIGIIVQSELVKIGGGELKPEVTQYSKPTTLVSSGNETQIVPDGRFPHHCVRWMNEFTEQTHISLEGPHAFKSDCMFNCAFV
jgi:hypothetical protein